MKSSLMRPALVALALAFGIGLAACGGKASFAIGGTANQLQYSGLTVSSNGQTLKVEPATVGTPSDVHFEFPNRIEYGDLYDIKIVGQPAHQSCVLVSGGADTAGRLAIINARIDCALLTPQLGGTISGLKADGLVLTNGSSGGTVALSGTSTTAADGTVTKTWPTAFVFPAKVTYGQTYGVTVLTQPTGQTCTVANGAGIMGDDNVSNVAVTCTP
jgi:hypothetical protein